MVVKNFNAIKRAINKVDPTMGKIFIPWILKHPKSIKTMIKLAKAYKKARRIRNQDFLDNNLKIPPFIIISITSQCNLRCSGCYAAAAGTLCQNSTKKPLAVEQWEKIIQESVELGIFGFIIAGGEPFIVQKLLNLSERFNDRLFIIFTNGTLLNHNTYKQLKNLANVIVVVSIEGSNEQTNLRRGCGVYEKAIETIKQLDKNGNISGISVTINRNNYEYWMNENNIDSLILDGVRLGFLLEYIPVEGDGELMLSQEESKKFREKVLYYRKNKQIFLIHSPGDEEYMGGCVSAGRGFAHITPMGDLTPCPVSNIATHNLTKSTLREGLESPLFKIIRENEHLLETEGSPCALFSHSAEVEALASKVKAYKTSSY
ncbi:MAG: radical SAM/SPASM domain-containing protein [Candidatus Hermodarchaeota archaeon]